MSLVALWHVACGIFQGQGSNLCLLHWQADSLPLSHQGSPSLPPSLFFSFVCTCGVLLAGEFPNQGLNPGCDSETMHPKH